MDKDLSTLESDLITLWDKVMGSKGLETDMVASLYRELELEDGNQCLPRNDKLVIAPFNHKINIPIDQTGKKLDISSKL